MGELHVVTAIICAYPLSGLLRDHSLFAIYDLMLKTTDDTIATEEKTKTKMELHIRFAYGDV